MLYIGIRRAMLHSLPWPSDRLIRGLNGAFQALQLRQLLLELVVRALTLGREIGELLVELRLLGQQNLLTPLRTLEVFV